MKVFNKVFAGSIAFVTLMGISTGVFANHIERVKKANPAKQVVDYNVEEPALEMSMDWETITPETVGLESLSFDATTGSKAMIYDREDNLVAEGTVDVFGFATDQEFQQVLTNAALLMTYDGVEYYRLND